jgi:hypothetical protein
MEWKTLRRDFIAVRTSIQNPTAARVISGGQFNRLLEVEEGATYRGRAHKTTRGIIPRQDSRIARSSVNYTPYATHGVNGVAATVTGSYSSATPHLHLNYAANTSEWKAIGGDGTTPFPPDTIILDGRKSNAPEEYWVLR